MAKIKVTQQQRANAIEARDVMWPSVPPENVSAALGQWTQGNSDETACGTVACFGGWCARWPAFVALGVELDSEGAPVIGSRHYDFGVAAALFGDRGLFAPREPKIIDPHPADEGFTGTDHELVTHRLNWLIENSEVA